jgi:SAM-dependent methyltransferase
VGVDVAARAMPDVVGSVLALPIRTESVDSVICTEVLEHVREPGTGLAEINRVLRPGGLLYLTVPQSWGLHHEPEDYFRFTCYGVEYLLDRHGFVLRRLDRMGGLFTYSGASVVELLVQGLFRLFDLIGLKRGRYKLAALIVSPINFVLLPLVALLDRFDKTNAYGWAVLAEKPPTPSGPSDASTA